MKRKTIHPLLALLTALLVLAACTGQDSAPEAEAPPTEAAAEEAETSTETGETTESTAADNTEGLRIFVIDPAASTASYLVDEEFLAGALDKLGIAAGDYDIVGSTTDIEGRLEIDAGAVAVGVGEFQVNLTTLKTDQNRRDNWIQDNGPNFGSFPLATFVVTAVEGAPDSYTEGEEASFRLIGDMTIREVSQPVTFDVTAILSGDTLTGTALAAMKMTDFGIDPPNFANTLKVADDFFVQVEFTAMAQ